MVVARQRICILEFIDLYPAVSGLCGAAVKGERVNKKRWVRITIEVVGQTDRDAWEWGDAIARSLKDDFVKDGEDFGPVAVQCFDVEDPAKEPA